MVAGPLDLSFQSETLFKISGKKVQNPFEALKTENWMKHAVRMFRRCDPLNNGTDCDHMNLKKFSFCFSMSPNSESLMIPVTSNLCAGKPVFIWWILCKIFKVSASSPCENVNFGDSGIKNIKMVAHIKLGRPQIKRNSRQGFIVIFNRSRWKLHSWFIVMTANVGSERLIKEYRIEAVKR